MQLSADNAERAVVGYRQRTPSSQARVMYDGLVLTVRAPADDVVLLLICRIDTRIDTPLRSR
jgi:hypothetical protein